MSHGGGSDERWLVSYADFITLLMVLFIMLYSGSQVDIRKYKQLAESLSAAFGGGPVKVVDPLINASGGSTSDSEVPKPISVPGIPTAPLSTDDVTSQLTDMLSSTRLSSELMVENNIEGMLISLGEKLLFSTGTADLSSEAYPILDRLADMVGPMTNPVRVIGHTNTAPPADPRYADNWELSMHRALVIVRYLIGKGMDPARLTATGAGSTQPLFPDDTPAHMALNSRAEIIIVYKVSSNLIDLGFTDSSQPSTGGGG